ncbi:hypothetical protein SAMN05421505_1148 [Sinosporangium album]|uniref:Meckel syndrome type 1 protein n=1 Tax=Sinosporangium album TaxID=504805 RepID=A0A1G8BDE7_9ACTN|nr:hypothetical protein [Sinosporangium album]SDH31121.1 hypothetical protein SAMN05421505_1148 [Sinosporangium album]
MTAVVLSLVAVVLLVLVVVALGMRSMSRRESALPPERLKEMAEQEEVKPSRSTDEFAASEPRMDKFTPDFSPIDVPRPKPSVPRVGGPRGRRGVDEFGTADDYDEEYWGRVRADDGGFGGSIAAKVGASRPLSDAENPELPAAAPATGAPVSADAVTMQAPLPNLAGGQMPVGGQGLADLVEPAAPHPAPVTSAAVLAEQKTMTFAAPTPEVLAQYAPGQQPPAQQPPAQHASAPRETSARQAAPHDAPHDAPHGAGPRETPAPGRRASGRGSRAVDPHAPAEPPARGSGGRGGSRTANRASSRTTRSTARGAETPAGDALATGGAPVGDVGPAGRGVGTPPAGQPGPHPPAPAVPPAARRRATGGFPAPAAPSMPAAGAPAATPSGAPADPRGGAYPSGAPAFGGPDSTDATWPRTGSYPPNPAHPGASDIFDDQSTPAQPVTAPHPVQPAAAPTHPPAAPGRSAVAASWPSARAYGTSREQTYPKSYEVRSGWATIDDDAVTGPTPAASTTTGPARAVSPHEPAGGPARPADPPRAGGPAPQAGTDSWPSFGDMYGPGSGSGTGTGTGSSGTGTAADGSASPGEPGRRRGSRGSHRAPDPDYPDYYR